MSNSLMTDVERSRWMAILDAASRQPPDQINDEWEWILDQLGLQADYFLAVLEAIRQGRWITAKNPRAYLKTVAKREAQKMGLLSDPTDILELVKSPSGGERFSMEETLDNFAHVRGTSEAIKGEDGVWRRGRGRDDDCGQEDGDDNPNACISFQCLVSKGLLEIREPSASYKAFIEQINSSTDEFHIHVTPIVRPNWEKWAALAGFDQWDCLALKYRLAGMSRGRAMTEQPSEISRKALQAAWKKFDRRGRERLRQAPQKYFSIKVSRKCRDRECCQ